MTDPLGRGDPGEERETRQRQHDAVRPPERDGPCARAHPRDPVAGEARGHPPADQQDEHDDEAKRGADRELGQALAGVLDMEGDINEGERQHEDRDLQVPPVLAGDDLARDERGEDDKEPDVDRRRGHAADRRRGEHGDPARRPQRDEGGERDARHRQASGPVGDRGQQEARDDRAAVAEDHLVRVPVDRREGGRDRDRPGEDGRP